MQVMIKNKYSNCLLAAIKAKLKNWKQVKIIFVSPWKNNMILPHWLWIYKDQNNNEWIFDWCPEDRKSLKWYEELWYAGYIRKRTISCYHKWIKYKDMRK